MSKFDSPNLPGESRLYDYKKEARLDHAAIFIMRTRLALRTAVEVFELIKTGASTDSYRNQQDLLVMLNRYVVTESFGQLPFRLLVTIPALAPDIHISQDAYRLDIELPNQFVADFIEGIHPGKVVFGNRKTCEWLVAEANPHQDETSSMSQIIIDPTPST